MRKAGAVLVADFYNSFAVGGGGYVRVLICAAVWLFRWLYIACLITNKTD